MSREDTNIDTRVTAYAFGELSPADAEIFEQELLQSAGLQAELAEIRDAIAALETEFRADSKEVGPSHREEIQRAISSRAAVLPPPVTRALPIPAGESAYRRAMTVAVLATCALIVVAFVVPELRGRGGQEVVQAGAGSERAELRQLVSDFNEAVESERWGDAAAIAEEVQAIRPDDPIARTLILGSQLQRGRPEKDTGDTTLAEPNDVDGGPSSQVASLEMDEVNPADPSTKTETVEQLAPATEPTAAALADRATGTDSGEAQPADADQSMDATADMSLGGIGAGAGLESEDAGLESEMDEMAMAMDMGMDMSNMAMQSDMGMDRSMGMGMMGAGVVEGSGGDGRGMGDGGRPPRKQRSRVPGMEGMMMGGMGGMMMEDTAMDSMGMGGVAGDRDGMLGMEESVPALGPLEWHTGDRYAPIVDNPFRSVTQAPLSTFSIDVDTASYTKVRSLINQRALPNPNAVRVEEFINYFDYDYPAPTGEHPFSASMDVVECPWDPSHRLARIGIQGKRLEQERPFSNLVFLLDVSGSMDEPNKLPLLIEGMKMLTDQLTENDRVAIVVYAGAAGVVLDSTRGDKKQEITAALDRLRAGGSTNGGQGILMAYQIARDHFIPGGTNRVILCSDGDFNVGVTNVEELVRLVKKQATSNIFLTVLGFGTGNHNDQMMEQISNQANGNYAFVDSRAEAKKVLMEEMAGTLVTIAKDVKIQVEFNPAKVAGYRLIGYENRVMAAEDFANDKKDAGEIGAGHRVTALFELVPQESDLGDVFETESGTGDLRYQEPSRLSMRAAMGELFILKMRYKQPEGDRSSLVEFPVKDDGKAFRNADRDLKLAAAAAGFGMLLRDSPHKGNLTMSRVAEIATEAALGDDFGYRAEFVELWNKARRLRGD